MTTHPAHATSPDQRRLNIEIAANFLATPLSASLALWLGRLNILSTPKFAPYDSVIQQLLGDSRTHSHADLCVTLIRLESWYHHERAVAPAMVQHNVDLLISSVVSAAKRQPGTVFLIMTCPLSAALQPDEDLAAAEERLKVGVSGLPNVDFLGVSELHQYYPATDYAALFIRGSAEEPDTTHYSPLCYATLGTMIARRISALFTEPRKVIAVDCDNTLWSGVCGEQGPLGVSVESGHRELQRALLEQRERGRLLCVCSKNNEADALAVFDQHQQMLIRREHLTAIRANWQPKVDNLRSLASELGLGLDAFLFVDDDRFECESVAAICPAVRTVRMDCTDHTSVARTLLQVWEFDRGRVTAEDIQRGAYYRQESERNNVRDTALSLEEFLEKLDLKVVISALEPADISRAVQLTQRVNQFNLNGIRRSAAYIYERLDVATCLMVCASDRFGDYGVIGFVVYRTSDRALHVETLVLSCRALGRGVERRLASYLADAARASGQRQIEFEFLPTAKNMPMQGFLAEIGAKHDASGSRVVFVER